MRFRELRVASLPLPPAPAPALVHTWAPWTYPGLDTALKSEALSPTKKRSAAGTTTCAYTVVPLAMGLAMPS